MSIVKSIIEQHKMIPHPEGGYYVEVFKTKDIYEGWDGKNSISGKYAWVIMIIDEMGAKREKFGEVMLIK